MTADRDARGKPGPAAVGRGMAGNAVGNPVEGATATMAGGMAVIVVGAEDALTPPGEAQSLAQAISGARLVELPGAGHLANLEAPEAFAAAVATLP